MAAFDFPNSPSVNQTYTANGVTFTWNGTIWQRTSASSGAQGGTGAQGSQGATGVAGLTISTSAPSSPSAGDMWWDSDSGLFLTYYNDGNSSQWVELNQGPMGAQGAQGHQGSAGAQGAAGAQGSAGAQGAQGHQGATGSGAQGSQGHQGANGAQGSAGAQGTQGHQGASGPSITINNNANTRVITASGNANEFDAQANLTFSNSNNDPKLTISGTGHAQLNLTSTSGTDHTGINFGDSADINAGMIQYSNTGNSMQFHTDGDERLRIDSSGRALIGGGSSPTQVGDGRLIVYASERLHPAIKADCLVGGSNAANGFTLLADNYLANESICNFGISYSGAGLVLSRGVKVSDAADDTYLSSMDSFAMKPAVFKLDDSGDILFLNTDTSATTTTDNPVTLYERLRITSDGFVGINENSPQRHLHVNSGSSDIVALFESSDTSAQIQIKDGNGTCSIECLNDFRFENSNAQLVIFKSDKDVQIMDGNLVVASGHGIDFSATGDGSGTMSNELLDDYEEGSFTPTYNYSGRSFSYYLQSGSYVKIGKTVHFILAIGTSSTSGSGTSGPVKIDGLPFTSNARSAVAIRATNFASDPARTATVENGATFMELIKETSTGTADMTGSSLSTSAYGNIVYAAGHYETNS